MYFRSRFWMLATFVVGLVGQTTTNGATVTLSDLGQNSQIVMDTTTGVMTEWSVEGVNQLEQRRWFYRLGAAAIGNPELAVDATNLIEIGSGTTNANFLPGDESMAVAYADPFGRFTMLFTYSLASGNPGSGQATFVETLRVDNFSNGPLALSLYLYGDYNLNATPYDTSLLFGDPRALTQVDLSSDTNVSHEAAVTIVPAHFSAGVVPALISSLTDGDSTVLNDNPSASFADLAYGFQWDLLLGVRQSFTLGTTNSITTQVVPEASSVALIGLGLVSGIYVIRRRRG